MATARWLYPFAAGDPARRDLLGGKGAGLAEMTRAGLPVPPGFTVTTAACRFALAHDGAWPDGLDAQRPGRPRMVPTFTTHSIGQGGAQLYSGSLAHFRGGTTAELVGFLRTIVRNRAIDVLKHRNRWVPTAAPGERVAHESSALGVADAECVEFLRQTVAGLKREDQELYFMKARGLKEREIAEQTGRPPGTIASQIARLLERLRASLRDRGCV